MVKIKIIHGIPFDFYSPADDGKSSPVIIHFTKLALLQGDRLRTLPRWDIAILKLERDGIIEILEGREEDPLPKNEVSPDAVDADDEDDENTDPDLGEDEKLKMDGTGDEPPASTEPPIKQPADKKPDPPAKPVKAASMKRRLNKSEGKK